MNLDTECAHLDTDALNLQLGSSTLTNVDSDKLLGVIIDKNLSWNAHVDSICQKIKSRLFLLQKIRKFLPMSARKKFFNSYILPHFDYCIAVWGSFEDVNYMKRLDRLVKKGMRLILGCPFDTPSNHMYLRLKWFPLKYRYKHVITQLVYKGLHGMAPPYINELLRYYEPSTDMELRSVTREDLDAPFAKKEIYRRCFSYVGPKFFNQLPVHVRQAKSFNAFKTCSHLHFYQEFRDTI